MSRAGIAALATWLGRLGGALLLVAGLVPGVAATPPAAVVQSLREAETSYAAGDFSQALEAYRRALAAGWTSASLYYDLGCTAQKTGETGWAIGYFEEARRRAPHDPDIRHNLSVVLAQARDRASPESASPLLNRVAAVLDAYAPSDAVTVLAVALWIAALVVILSWFLGEPWRSMARRARPWAGALVLVAAGLLFIKSYQVHSAPSGVIVEGQVGVRAGPGDAETVQFALHSGTFVRVGRNAGSWIEVALTPETRGWVPREAILSLSPPRWFP